MVGGIAVLINRVDMKEIMKIPGIYTFGYKEKDVNFLFPGETHDFYEFIYMDKGYCYLLIEDAGFKINSGEMFIFGRNQNHILWSDGKAAPSFLTVSFDLEFEDTVFFEFRRFLVDAEIKEIISKMMKERLNAFEGGTHDNIMQRKENAMTGAEQLIHAYLVEILLKLYRGRPFLGMGESQSSIVRQKTDHLILGKTMQYINTHIFEDIYLEKVAQSIPVSSPYLNKIFRRSMHTSVIEYANGMKPPSEASCKQMVRCAPTKNI